MNRGPLALATVSGAVCLAISGPFGLVASALTLAGFVGGARLRFVHDWTIVHLAVLAICAVVLAGLGVVPAFSLLLGWLAAHRAIVADGRADERVLLLLGTLMALVGTVGSLSLALAPALLTFATAAPVALLRANGLSDRRVTVGTALGTLVLSVAFFALVPRIQGGLLAAAGETPGEADFADDVALGDEEGNPEREVLVMRVRTFTREGAPVRGPQYLRGRAMDHFDGTRWTASGRVRRASTGAWGLRAEVMLEPLVGAIVYGPPDLLYATSDQGPLLQGGDGEMAHGQPGRRVAYETFSYSRPLTEADRPLPELLQLPPLDPRVRALADSLAPGRDDVASIAAAATAVFREGFVYTLDPPAPEGDPLAWFLFDSREGHCEYYASALAVLLRARGVPARLATGFYSAEYNEAGQYLSVRRGHAHAWVEVAVPGGWAVLDATPSGGLVAPEVTWWQVAEESVNAAWLSLVLDYDLRRQFDAAAALGRGFVAPLPGDPVRERSRESMAGVGVLLGVLFLSGTVLRVVLWWLARAPPWAGRTDPLVGRFRRARARAVARGWAIPGELPPVAAGEWLVERAGPAGEPLLHLAQLLYRSRYGGEVVDPADVDATFRAANAIPRAR